MKIGTITATGALNTGSPADRGPGGRRAQRLTRTRAAAAVIGMAPVLGVALVATTTASPAYGASGSWLAYVNTRVGRSCSVETAPGHAVGGVKATETMTLMKKSHTGSGTILHYRTVTTVGSKTVSTDSAWDIFSNGTMGLPPGVSGSSGGYKVTVVGSEVYPSPAQLRAGQKSTRSLSITLAANGGQGAAAIAAMAANGKSLTLKFTLKSAPAPAVGSISTPGGTYHNVAGVVTSSVSVKAVNGSAALNKEWSLVSPTFSKLLTSTQYYAPGVGPVKVASPGTGLSLVSAGCKG